MAESVVSFVGQTIAKQLVDEVKFLWGVGGKVEDLLKELLLIQELLRDMDARREHNKTIEEWVAQLRDIAYDAEDVIEQYILRVALKKGQNTIKAFACFVAKCMCVRVHDVGMQVKGLKSGISDLRIKMRDMQPVIECERECKRSRSSKPKQTYAYYEEAFFGREDSIKQLVKELKDGKKHRVISICGMGGLGKTALAKEVFAHDEVKNHFNGFAWECINQEYPVRDILEGLFIKLNPKQRKEVKEMRNDELLEKLHETQTKKRCIVVLDDIWTKKAWDDLQCAFPVKSTENKLLITTRNREIAEYVDAQGYFHELRCLSDKESWELLMNRAFPEMKGINEDMKKLGDEVLKKCEGLPSAIVVLGDLLAIKKWEMFNRNIKLHVSDKISKVLALSYDDLPWHLKRCFLYLCSFPTDEEIPAAKVLLMWIAEGFVLTNAYDKMREITVEDVAEQYLIEFVNRGLVQPRFTLSGKIKTCRLHDLMRDLCISKATQESFLSIINIQSDNEVDSTCKTRRLSLHMHENAEGNPIPEENKIESTMLRLRTLMFFYSRKSVEANWKQFQPMLIKCKFLRVLKLEGLSSMRGKLPKSVGDLVLLRYLSLAGCGFEGLPQSMGSLVCMEILDLILDESILVKLPNVLWKMRRLRHLHLPISFAVHGSKKLRLDSLKQLQTLRNFCPEKCDVNDVGQQTNLRKLTVRKQDGSEKLKIIPQLVKFTLKHLRSSSFRFSSSSSSSFTEGELSQMSSYCHFCKLSILGKIEKLPEHNKLPQKLRKLVLMGSQLKEDPMPILEKLLYLFVLSLSDAYGGTKMVCSEVGFPQLKRLFLDDLKNLEEWRVAKGAMPHLSQLKISKCAKLKTEHAGPADNGDEFWKDVDIHSKDAKTEEIKMINGRFSEENNKLLTKSKGRALDFALDFALGELPAENRREIT